MVRQQQQVAAILQQDPNIASVMSSVGAGGSSAAGNSGRVFLRLKPRGQRALSADQLIDALRTRLNGIPGMRVYMQNPPLIRIGGQLTRSLYQYTLQGPD